jgi:hypothetical protein
MAAPPGRSSGARWGYAGAALFGASGGVLGYFAWRDAVAYRAERPSALGGFDAGSTTDQIEGRALATRARRFALAADVCYGLAAASLVTGVVLQLRARPATALAPTTRVSVGLGAVRIRF